MATFIVSYDLNGPRPSHAELDKHLGALGPMFARGRLLETVWYVAGPTDVVQLRGYLLRILSANDQLLVVEATAAAWSNLLIDDLSFQRSFNLNVRKAA